MKIVITGRFPAEIEEKIRSQFPEEWSLRIVPPEEAEKELADAHVLIPEHMPVTAELLDGAPRLRLVQTGAGYDNVDLAACTARGIQVCCAAGVNAGAVAEHVMAVLLCRYKNLLPLDAAMKERREGELRYAGAELTGKSIGIVGLGRVGRRTAALAAAFGMRVLGCSRSGLPVPGVQLRDLDSLCRECDVISLHVPLNESTRHLIDADRLRLMKRDALLINTSRGAVVDQEALIRALESGQIGGACLDVFEEEPLPDESPLRDLDNVILTPHTAGLPDGVKYHRRRIDFFVRNIRKLLKRETPDCRVN